MIYIYAEFLYHYCKIHSQKLHKNILNQKGQTLVEFILLLCVLMFTSMLFLGTVNRGTASLWEFVVKTLVEDPSVKVKLR